MNEEEERINDCLTKMFGDQGLDMHWTDMMMRREEW
jgi:hypothetical protein